LFAVDAVYWLATFGYSREQESRELGAKGNWELSGKHRSKE
jgi:hypothetical protein